MCRVDFRVGVVITVDEPDDVRDGFQFYVEGPQRLEIAQQNAGDGFQFSSGTNDVSELAMGIAAEKDE